MNKAKQIPYLTVCLLLIFGASVTGFAESENSERKVSEEEAAEFAQSPGTVSALVLPQGVFLASVKSNFYRPIDTRFDPDGNEENVATDLNRILNSNVFPALGIIEDVFGMQPSTASIGTSVVNYEYKFTDLILELGYGLTDTLSLGLKIPYFWNKTEVKNAALDTTLATVGKNPDLNTLAPLGVPGTVPLTTEDTQNLIGRGLDINGDGEIDIPGYGFKPIKTLSASGISDIEAGLRYQYFKTNDWKLAFTGGLRFPTGEVDDPDNLIDSSFGNGAYALLFRLNNSYTGIKNVLLSAEFRYDLYLEDSQVKRVPDDVNRPLTLNKEEVDIKRGNIFEFEGAGIYSFTESFTAQMRYRYGTKVKDQVSGNMGFNYQSLEDETNWSYQLVGVGLSYSTIPLFMAKKFPVPINASIDYENVFAGSNNYLKQDYLSLKLALFF